MDTVVGPLNLASATTLSAPIDPFRAHLVALLSVYELGSFSGTPIPRYEGPTDWQTEAILRSLDAMAHRMHSAEETVGDLRKQLKCGTDDNEGSCQQGPTSKEVTSVGKELSSPPRRVNMTISLDDLQSSTNSDPFDLSSRAYGDCMKAYHQAQAAAPPTSHNSVPTTAYAHCPIIIPPGPLAAAAFESGISAVEELRLLKSQISDVARVCNAVARGDLCQKITVPVQGVVMVQLKDLINTMVDNLGQFAKEVTRSVSQEVGTEEQTVILEGTWRELIRVVNKLAADLVG